MADRRKLEDARAAGADSNRPRAVARRHDKGFRTARENLLDLCDAGSFMEYGELAVAAQRQRRELDDLRSETPGDGVITGIANINADRFGEKAARAAVIVNDYSVLAGTQGFYHHKKIDRLLDLAERDALPVVMYTEGGGGRPGDTDVMTQVSALDVPTFARWAGLSGKVPRIVVNNGYCFAGNAALFGSGDIRIATKRSWIGMAGPAMIEAGGLGEYESQDIGPTELHVKQGVVDVCADDEAAATQLAKDVLGYFQGPSIDFDVPEQSLLRQALPENRRFTYKVRNVIELIADTGSFTELGGGFGSALITGFVRVDGKPFGLLASDNQVMAGAIDADAAEKASRFLRLWNAHGIPILSLVDTPGFMVGPDSESQAAVRHMSEMFAAGAALTVPLVAIVLRKAYGLGAMAMTGGGFREPVCTAAWPTGEFGAMGLEGAVRLGFRKELDAEPDEERRNALFDRLVQDAYEKGSALEVAGVLEIDSVIDPADTRRVIGTAESR
ncbi:MAG: carboxyl transferase domain-containing protein [Woeseiaceae bacterium]|nr:carboxyl transferase domain-containing protein [Woeseiaceae bacterium]